MKKYDVLFCDLDGTLIDTVSGETFPKGVWDMKLKFDVFDAIRKMKPGYVFIVTNQGGIEKGFVDRDSFFSKADYIISCIDEYCELDGNIMYDICESNNKNCHNRKPNTGMLEFVISSLKETYNVVYDKEQMLMVGDASGLPGQFSDSDKKTAENFGIDYMDVNEFLNEYK